MRLAAALGGSKVYESIEQMEAHNSRRQQTHTHTCVQSTEEQTKRDISSNVRVRELEVCSNYPSTNTFTHT